MTAQKATCPGTQTTNGSVRETRLSPLGQTPLFTSFTAALSPSRLRLTSIDFCKLDKALSRSFIYIANNYPSFQPAEAIQALERGAVLFVAALTFLQFNRISPLTNWYWWKLWKVLNQIKKCRDALRQIKKFKTHENDFVKSNREKGLFRQVTKIRFFGLPAERNPIETQ